MNSIRINEADNVAVALHPIVKGEMIDASGPDHDKVFTCVVSLNGDVIGRGSGHSKKEAEQNAACSALSRMDE
mgnify:CR=1 FL=1